MHKYGIIRRKSTCRSVDFMVRPNEKNFEIATTRRILDTVQLQFSRQGYDSARLEDLTKDAGCIACNGAIYG